MISTLASPNPASARIVSLRSSLREMSRRDRNHPQGDKTMTNSETKICQDCRQSFTIEPDDFSFYETIKVPPPTRFPVCRLS